MNPTGLTHLFLPDNPFTVVEHHVISLPDNPTYDYKHNSVGRCSMANKPWIQSHNSFKSPSKQH